MSSSINKDIIENWCFAIFLSKTLDVRMKGTKTHIFYLQGLLNQPTHTSCLMISESLYKQQLGIILGKQRCLNVIKHSETWNYLNKPWSHSHHELGKQYLSSGKEQNWQVKKRVYVCEEISALKWNDKWQIWFSHFIRQHTL